MKQTILIIGVAGLLGSRLADWIIENHPECEIIGIDDLSGGYKENIHPKVNFININLVKDTYFLRSIFEIQKPDYVFHFAAYAAEGLSPFIRTYNYDNNLRATAAVVNECIRHNVKRLVFTSTLAVYGYGYGGFFDETQIPKPIDPYGVAKYACEMDIQIAGEQHGLDWCIIRPHNVYGVKQNIWDKYRNVLGIWMYQHLNDEPMTIFGDGEQTRDFTYVGTVVNVIIDCISNKVLHPEPVNLAYGNNVSLNQVTQLLKYSFPDLKVTHLSSRDGDVLHSKNDPKLVQLLYPNINVEKFETSLQETINWFKKSNI